MYAPEWFGNETILYSAYPYKVAIGGTLETVYQIPFLICMGWSFFFTMLVMIVMSFAGPKINPKAFELDREMFQREAGDICFDYFDVDDIGSVIY